MSIQLESISNFIMAYNLLKKIGTPFKDFDAYKLGLIDEEGKKLKSPETDEERDSMDSYTKIVLNIKRIMSRFGVKNQSSQKIISLFLLKEGTLSETTQRVLLKEIKEKYNILLERNVISDEMAEAVVDTELTYF